MRTVDAEQTASAMFGIWWHENNWFTGVAACLCWSPEMPCLFYRMLIGNSLTVQIVGEKLNGVSNLLDLWVPIFSSVHGCARSSAYLSGAAVIPGSPFHWQSLLIRFCGVCRFLRILLSTNLCIRVLAPIAERKHSSCWSVCLFISFSIHPSVRLFVCVSGWLSIDIFEWKEV